MKPNNPMEQLKQWKAASDKNLVSSGENRHQLQKAPPVAKSSTGNGEQKAEKRKGKLFFNPLALKYSQISRQFQLIQDSNKRCLEVYPGDFHHKIKFRDEIVDLMNKLAGGGNLLNALAKDGNLSREDTAGLKYFNQANKYLLYKFSEVVEQIGALNSERSEQQKGSK